MAIKLVYQPPKWEKEQKKELQLFRQSKGQDITLINLQRILKEEEEFPAMRNYQELYTNLQLKYRILAGSSYLRDSLDIIEIPEMFFDDTICKIDTSEIKLPFFDDALEQLKKLGII